MNSRTVGLQVAGIVFGLVCLAQLARLALRAEVIVAGYTMPLWPSGVAALVAGSLCVWMWRLAAGRDGERHV